MASRAAARFRFAARRFLPSKDNEMHAEPNEHLTIRIAHNMRVFSRWFMELFPCQKRDKVTNLSASSHRLIALTKNAFSNLRS